MISNNKRSLGEIASGKPQKNCFFGGPANKRGGGKGLATKIFFEALKKSQIKIPKINAAASFKDV